jgi:hypothetical protein
MSEYSVKIKKTETFSFVVEAKNLEEAAEIVSNYDTRDYCPDREDTEITSIERVEE